MSDESIADSGMIDLISSFLGSSQPAPVRSILPSYVVAGGNDINQTQDVNPQSNIQSLATAVQVIVFSKDRPWQLQQLLRSMKLYSHQKTESRIKVDISIIIHASQEFREGYNKVEAEFQRWLVHFFFEGDVCDSKQSSESGDRYSNSFSILLRHLLMDDDAPSLLSHDANSQQVIMFLTDDCLLLEPLDSLLRLAIRPLAYPNGESQSAFNFVSRLHPGISWSQTRNLPSPPPRNEFRYLSINSSEGVYLYNRDSASVEWNYPFDLSGGIYRRSDMLSLLNSIHADGLSHPNLFEMRCNEVLKTNSLTTSVCNKPMSAIPTRPLLVILAINRVQDVCKAPLASNTLADGGKPLGVDPSNTLDLLSLLDNDTNLDVDWYKTSLHNTSHIGDFYLCDEEKKEPSSTSSDQMPKPKLSVLIPVHSGPPDAASHAIISIIMQPFDEGSKKLVLNANDLSDLLPFQIVLVDDRCTDGSIKAMIGTAKSLASLLEINLCIRDSRSSHQNSTEQTSTDNADIFVDIVASPRPGIASSLNYGLGYCQSEVVARMDADDIAAPHRFLNQLRFIHANQSFDAIGTSTVLFSTPNDNQTPLCSTLLPYCNTCHELGISVQKCNAKTALFISDPGFVAWSMLFSCTVQHPSIIFRKSTIQQMAGYDETIQYCEDYELWLRLMHHNSQSMTNLPVLGLWHRKHRQSKSALGSAKQKEDADNVCYNEIMRLFRAIGGSCNVATLGNVSNLRNPSGTLSPEEVDAAAFLLESIEHAFIELNAQSLTQQEIRLIRMDVDNRIAELAAKFVNRSMAWKIWCRRCPDRGLERLSLICHSKLKATD